MVGTIINVVFSFIKILLAFLPLLFIKFIRYIDIADALVAVLLGWAAMRAYAAAPNGISLAVGVGLAVVLIITFKTSKVGFVLVSGVFSLFWAYLAASFVQSTFHANKVWYWIAFAITAAGLGFCHWVSTGRKAVNEQYKAAQRAGSIEG